MIESTIDDLLDNIGKQKEYCPLCKRVRRRIHYTPNAPEHLRWATYGDTRQRVVDTLASILGALHVTEVRSVGAGYYALVITRKKARFRR